MRSWMIAAALGLGWVSLWPQLPPVAFTALAPVLLLWLFFTRQYFPRLVQLGVFLLATLWAVHYGHGVMNAVLPQHLAGDALILEGEVVGLPNKHNVRGEPMQRFNLRLIGPVCTLDKTPVCFKGLGLIRLSWYEHDGVSAGQRWRLQVVLRRPRGLSNPGSFDYQAWLLLQGIGAVGYVNNGHPAQLLGDSGFSIDRLRERFSQQIDRQLEPGLGRAVLKALLVADKREIAPQQWQQFVSTGIVHLLVISGLHVGLVSALAFVLARQLALILAASLCPQRCGAVAAVLTAICYSAAAGFSLPTQRALIMVIVWMAVVFFRRSIAPVDALWVALVICLCIDPLAPIGLSFWLSFGAVAVLAFGLAGRQGRRSYVRLWLLPQWVVFIGLIPCLAIFLGQFSLLSPLANIIAIPLFSLIIVPGNLLAALIAQVNESVAGKLWQALAWIIERFISALAELAGKLSNSQWLFADIAWPLQLLALLAVIVLLLPRGLPARYLGLVLLAPLFVMKAPQPSAGDVWLTVLDVGQGLSIVVQTQRHRLVYDVGPAVNSEFSAATTVLQPFLQFHGIAQLDHLVLSHGDNDHAGGWRQLLKTTAVQSLSYGERLPGFASHYQSCQRGQRWQWEGVEFEFLHPAAATRDRINNANNRSCVLKITTASSAFLLPGDIDASQELRLLEHYGASNAQALAAQVLIAPHHGSNSSSSWPFIKRVNPDYVVFSSAYQHRFGHPTAAVVQRYQTLEVITLETRLQGAITFRTERGALLAPQFYRQHRRYWQLD